MILFTPPKKLYKGKKRLCMRHINFDKKLREWACTVRPGDYIATCSGFNEQVVSIEYHWWNEGRVYRGKKNNSWYLEEVEFKHANGRVHYCPGGGCALPKDPAEWLRKHYAEEWPLAIPEIDDNGCLINREDWDRRWKLAYPEILE